MSGRQSTENRATYPPYRNLFDEGVIWPTKNACRLQL